MSPDRDLRKYASQTTVQLVAGAVLILFILGLVLIGLIYGWPAAISGFICLLGAMLPLGLIWLFLLGVDWIVKKGNEE
jgi:hypothetical protein